MCSLLCAWSASRSLITVITATSMATTITVMKRSQNNSRKFKLLPTAMSQLHFPVVHFFRLIIWSFYFFDFSKIWTSFIKKLKHFLQPTKELPIAHSLFKKMEKSKKKEYQKDKYTQISSFKELWYILSGLDKLFWNCIAIYTFGIPN